MNFLKVPVIRSELILNTPERKEILADGPSKVANTNILGKGAYGTVFEAVFKDRPVAVKVVRNCPEVNRTENEALILDWRHRHIVRILKVESTVNFGIIIMEHFPGQNLQLILEKIQLPFIHQIFITLDVLSALTYCHKHDLLHLDIKPQNILIASNKLNSQRAGNTKLLELRKCRNYICKLCDFGSSIRISEQILGKIKAGGTIRYMSPEALRNEILTPLADIYSLGVTMWQLKHRHVPYNGILCNEVVAFQVVKNDLRPNSNFQKFLDESNEKNPKQTVCLCRFNKTVSMGLKFNVLNKKQRKSCRSVEKPSDLSNSISPSTRMGKLNQLSPCNRQRNAVRDLSNDLEIGIQDRKNHCGTNPTNIDEIFWNSFCWNNDLIEEKEKYFNRIFESCWQSDLEKRPPSTDLYKQLLALLK